MPITPNKSFLLSIAAGLLIGIVLLPTPAEAGTIVITDVDMARTDDSGTTEGVGSIIVVDDLLYLISKEDRFAIQDAAARELVVEVAAATSPEKSLQASIEIHGGEARITLSVPEDGSFIIIDDTTSL